MNSDSKTYAHAFASTLLAGLSLAIWNTAFSESFLSTVFLPVLGALAGSFLVERFFQNHFDSFLEFFVTSAFFGQWGLTLVMFVQEGASQELFDIYWLDLVIGGYFGLLIGFAAMMPLFVVGVLFFAKEASNSFEQRVAEGRIDIVDRFSLRFPLGLRVALYLCWHIAWIALLFWGI